ncbi:MAG TPA: hypothetical protein VMJ32_11055 [Pirellulales bacterium]|nr:hypothetical protein [Pirellulales bacterium]
MSTITKTAWRRLYVFLALALAVFLLALISVGFICHGFAMSPASAVQASGAQQSANSAGASPTNGSQTEEVEPDEVQPLPVPPEIKTAIAAANKNGLAAYRATQNAVDQYQATEIELQDLLDQHFDDLLHAAQTAADQKTAPAEENQSLPAPQPAPAAAAPQMAINPRWQDLENQIVQYRKQRVALLDTLLPTHPSVRQLDLSLSELERQLETVPKEIPASQAESAPLATSAAPQPEQNATANAPPASDARRASHLPSASSVFAQLLPVWQNTAEQYHELTTRLQSQQDVCYQALNTESTAWQRKAQIPANYLATLTVPKPAPAIESRPPMVGADPRLAIWWCGVLAIGVAALVARRAQVSEAVFRTASEVRQRLALTILGFLPQNSLARTSQHPPSEPRWIGRTLIAAELCLLVLAAVLAAMSISDRQFFTHFLANPLAACSQKFWC